jgi:hypothetical protein
LQRAELLRSVRSDIRGLVSRVRRDEYQRAMDRTCNLAWLRVIEYRVRTDARLTEDDRAQLLGSISDLARMLKESRRTVLYTA